MNDWGNFVEIDSVPLVWSYPHPNYNSNFNVIFENDNNLITQNSTKKEKKNL